MENLPSVTFLVLVERDSDSLVGCLETIALQEYPEQLVDAIVADGTGDKETSETARRFNASVAGFGVKDALDRIKLGLGSSRKEIVFVIGADCGLARTDWIRLMVRPFVERPEVAGVFTQMAEMPTDGSFARYLCRLNGDPFLWFVHGDGANPRRCHVAYAAAGSGEGYSMHIFPSRHPPLIRVDHGVGIRRSAISGGIGGDEPVAPLIRLVESGQPLAIVPEAGIHHQNVDGIWPFIKDCWARLTVTPEGWPVCSEQHPLHKSLWRRARRYLFELYGLTIIMPVLDGIWLSLMEKSTCMLWHGPAAIAMSWLVLVERAKRLSAGAK